MEVPAEPLREMGADRLTPVAIPNNDEIEDHGDTSAVSRCFQAMSSRTEHSRRKQSSVVIARGRRT